MVVKTFPLPRPGAPGRARTRPRWTPSGLIMMKVRSSAMARSFLPVLTPRGRLMRWAPCAASTGLPTAHVPGVRSSRSVDNGSFAFDPGHAHCLASCSRPYPRPWTGRPRTPDDDAGAPPQVPSASGTARQPLVFRHSCFGPFAVLAASAANSCKSLWEMVFGMKRPGPTCSSVS